MDCLLCKVTKISPNYSPFGGYLCDEEHMQCEVCYIKNKGKCGCCWKSLRFVCMTYCPYEVSNVDAQETYKPQSDDSQMQLCASDVSLSDCEDPAADSALTQLSSLPYSLVALRQSVILALRTLQQVDFYAEPQENSDGPYLEIKDDNESRDHMPFNELARANNMANVCSCNPRECSLYSQMFPPCDADDYTFWSEK